MGLAPKPKANGKGNGAKANGNGGGGNGNGKNGNGNGGSGNGNGNGRNGNGGANGENAPKEGSVDPKNMTSGQIRELLRKQEQRVSRQFQAHGFRRVREIRRGPWSILLMQSQRLTAPRQLNRRCQDWSKAIDFH